MVLHKQLRVLSRGTPCVIFDVDNGSSVCSGASDEILSSLIKSRYRNSFVKEVKLVDKDDDNYTSYNIKGNKSFAKITVKCKEVKK